MPTHTQLSTKWQSLWSVISSYLEIIFFIGETFSWQELLKLPTDTQLSTKWQSLWSVISSYLEIIFFIGETISCQELLKLIDAAMPYNILQFFGMEGYHFIGSWTKLQHNWSIDLLFYVTDRDTGTRIKTQKDSDEDWVWDFDLDRVIMSLSMLGT